MHDNSTTTQTFTYAVKPWESDLTIDTDYVIFEYLENKVYGTCSALNPYLNVTLAQNESKLFILIEDNGTPKVLSSDSVLLGVPVFADQKLSVELMGVEETQNVTRIFCSDLKQPQYVLDTPFNITQDYSSESKDITIKSESNIVVGWENSTDVSIVVSTVSLNNVSWNGDFETLTVYSNGTEGQQGILQVQTEGAKPYFLKVDGKET